LHLARYLAATLETIDVMTIEAMAKAALRSVM